MDNNELDSILNDKQEARQDWFASAWGWLMRSWLEVGALAFTSTRTYDIVALTSPAAWLPWVGIVIMELAWFFWRYQVAHAKSKEQTKVGWIGAGLTLTTIILTVLADAAWQASLRGVFGITSMPAWASTVSLYGIALLSVAHVLLIWLYAGFDPDVLLAQMYQKQKRELRHTKKQALLEMARQQTEAETAGWKRVMSKAAPVFGEQRFREAYHKAYGMYPEDTERLPKFTGTSAQGVASNGTAGTSKKSDDAGALVVSSGTAPVFAKDVPVIQLDTGKVTGNGSNPTRRQRTRKV